MRKFAIRRLSTSVLVLVLLSITSLPVATQPAYAATSVKVDPSIQYQPFEGFGTSLIWFANVIGGWSEPTRTELVDLLFDPVDGIGINVLRYNISGGDRPNQDWHRIGSDLPGYQPQEGVWDWTADANQRWVLDQAKQRLGNDLVVEAFSNSPPYWMTYSNTSTGNFNGGSENLKPEYFDDFAEYLTTVVKYFQDNWGITFKTLAPFNEPINTWWHAFNNQEGAYFTVPSQIDLINRIDTSLKQKGLTTQVAAMNNSKFESTLSHWNQYDELTQSKVAQINAHGYYGSFEDMRMLGAKSDSAGKDYWVAEVDGSGGSDPFGSSPNGFEPTGMTPSLNMAHMINSQLKEAQPTAWVLWQAVEDWADNIRRDYNWGLISANFEGQGVEGLDAEEYVVTKKYYAYGQFSKFIRPGARQIQINHPDAVSFIDETNNKLIIVQTNHGSSNHTYNYDLSDFTTQNSAEIYRTSSTENLEKIQNIAITNDTLTINTTGNSVTTLIVDFVDYTKAPPTFDDQTQYKIVNRNSGKVLSIGHSDKTTAGASVQQYSDAGEPHQRWYLKNSGRGYHQIVNAASGLLLEISGNSNNDGAWGIQWPINHGSNQQWLIVATDGYYKLISRNSGKLLDIFESSLHDGGQAIQWYDNGGYNQHWELVADAIPTP
ncbi:RICIN domain-containing protein [Paenibacillus yanchengensis]|uniref:RICIN domain-containing protein n=1 Tax=Paenibacillus yanchengensis TaxID=2035833 RepID=A0ABW4YRC2_9BACL